MRRAVATLAKTRQSLLLSSASTTSTSSSTQSLFDAPSLPVAARGLSQASTSASSSSISSSEPAPRPYYAVAVLERLPVVAPSPPSWEVEYQEWLRSSKTAAAGGRKKDLHSELGGEGGAKGGGAKQAKGGEQEEEEGGGGGGGGGKWRPAPRVTEADEKGDETSLRRCLDKRLFLVLGGNGSGGSGGSGALTSLPLPSAELREGESTRATAERALAEAVPALATAAATDSSSSSSSPAASVAEAYFVGNAPAGHLTLPGGKGGGGGAGAGGSGGTLFFHRAQLVPRGGSDLLSPSSSEALFGPRKESQHAWLTREELAERLGGGEIGELVKAML